jgi:uncharacterized membrane protein
MSAAGSEAAVRPTIGEALSAGWEGFKGNIGPLLVVAVAVFVVQALVTTLAPAPTEGFNLVYILWQLVGFVLSSAIGMVWTRLSLEIVDGSDVTMSDFTEDLHLIVPYVLASLISGILISIGLVLLVVPGIILALMFYFVPYRVVDAGSGPLDALRESAQLTRGHKGWLFGFSIVLILLNLLGLLLLVVGVLVTAAVSLIATAYVYRRLQAAQTPVAPPA